MITRRYGFTPGFIRTHRYGFLSMLLFISLFTMAHEYGWIHVHVPIAVPAVLGTALSILLGFRTNSAYDRWWEARKIWGAIVNDSRSFAREVLTLFRRPAVASESEMTSLQRELIYRQIAWCYTLSRDLRGQDPAPSLAGLLPPPEIEALATQANPHAAILHTQGQRLQHARAEGYVDDMLYLPLEGTLTRFSDHMGKCERIKGTIFPTMYSFFVRRMAWLFFLLLPLSLAAPLGWLAIPITYITGTVFVMIEAVAGFLEDPFENRATDTPTTAISRTIEINLRQQLGETDLPEKLVPVDGVLM